MAWIVKKVTYLGGLHHCVVLSLILLYMCCHYTFADYICWSWWRNTWSSSVFYLWPNILPVVCRLLTICSSCINFWWRKMPQCWKSIRWWKWWRKEREKVGVFALTLVVVVVCCRSVGKKIGGAESLRQVENAEAWKPKYGNGSMEGTVSLGLGLPQSHGLW